MKVFLIILTVVLVVALVGLAGAWSMFGEKLTAAKSVTKLEDGLYYMEYRGDYGFEQYLARGGAASEAEMAKYITEFLSGGFVKAEPEPVEQKFGCSALTAVTPDGCVMGRNYDWQGENGQAMIIHTKPKDGYESYSTSWLDFLGFGHDWKPEGMPNQYMALAAIYVPLDGINEKGLCVADLVNGDEAQTHQNTDKPNLTTTSAIRLLLDRAATVEEAIALLEQYDMNSSAGMSHHLAISDASGRSVVVEYVNDEMIVTETKAVTNHYLSAGEKYGVGNPESHARLERLLDRHPAITSVEEMAHTMEAVSYPGITQWSIVYDLEHNCFDFIWQRKFQEPYRYTIGS